MNSLTRPMRITLGIKGAPNAAEHTFHAYIRDIAANIIGVYRTRNYISGLRGGR